MSKRKLNCGQNCAELRAAYRGGAGAAAEPRDGEKRWRLVRGGRGGNDGDQEKAAERHFGLRQAIYVLYQAEVAAPVR